MQTQQFWSRTNSCCYGLVWKILDAAKLSELYDLHESIFCTYKPQEKKVIKIKPFGPVTLLLSLDLWIGIYNVQAILDQKN